MSFGTVGVIGRGMNTRNTIMNIVNRAYGMSTDSIVFDELMLTQYQIAVLERLKSFPREHLITRLDVNQNLRFYLLGRAPIKHVVSKKYIDEFNERTIGKIYKETVKEGCNAFDILQFTGDRSTERNDNTKGRKQTRTNTVGTSNGKDAYRHRFTFR